jgi:hypothetical protein
MFSETSSSVVPHLKDSVVPPATNLRWVDDIRLNNGVLELCRSLTTVPRHRPDKAVLDLTPDTFTALFSHK